MADVNESTSESDNIIVSGITDYSESPHTINKKAYNFTIGKGASNEYSARLGLNMSKLAEGEFTLVVEFFPPIMDSLSVNVVSKSLNIGQQSTKMFSKYSRSIVHMHKYDLIPPECIHIDMRFQGDKDSPTQAACYLITYGIEGKQSDVDSDVFDAFMVLENAKINFTVPVANFEPVFSYCGDLVHNDEKEVKMASTLTSASIMSDPSHFWIVNNEFVVKSQKFTKFILLIITNLKILSSKFDFVPQISVMGYRAIEKSKM